jgi:peptide/nickel transport system substrate-binding protein
MPVIPMWNNGMWAQVNNTTWTNWPSEEGGHYLPSSWGGYLARGAIYMFAEIEPAS